MMKAYPIMKTIAHVPNMNSTATGANVASQPSRRAGA